MAKHLKIGFLLVAFCLGFASCSPRALHEAQEVVAQADSLRAEGQLYADSARLAQACKSLEHWQLLYPTDYTHACYHYGRLLREQDNPVDAMQAFISATHTHTRDYHILGRVYSNMGDMCHLAGEFALSYDMFKKSADCFLQNADTLSYFYGLYDMAFEKAMLADSSSCNILLNQVERVIIQDDWLKTYCDITRAQVYLGAHQYKDAIYYANKIMETHPDEPTGTLILAQSYSRLGIKDSAAYYAEKVTGNPASSIHNLNNALYILTNDDETKDKESIRETAANRADMQKLIEIQQGKLSKAAQLLEQDIHRKPNLTWLYAIIATLCISGFSISIYIFNKRKKHRLLSQKVDELQQAASAIQEKHDDLSTRYTNYHQQVENEILRTCRVLRNSENITTELAWNDFDAMCQIIDRQFYMFTSKLKSKNILNETEVRLCVLVLLDMSRAEIAHTLPYALSSIGKLKDHTAKSLGTTGKNLRGFLLKLAIEG